jgi:hypothetical protein
MVLIQKLQFMFKLLVKKDKPLKKFLEKKDSEKDQLKMLSFMLLM